MTLTPILCVAIVAATLLIWWIIHRVNRMFEDRCPICGKLRQTVTYFMEESRDALRGVFRGTPYDTYKILTCGRGSCGHVRVFFRQKYMSPSSLWLKRTFKPWQLRRTPQVDAAIESAFAAPSIPARRCLAIPPVHLQGQIGPTGHHRDGRLGILLHMSS